MKIVDNRLNKENVNVGDFLIDSEGDVSLVVSFNGYSDFYFGILSLSDLEISVVADDLQELLRGYKNEFHLVEIVPQERVSLNIS